jgi:dTDP-4-dehydrorhamnose reductase
MRVLILGASGMIGSAIYKRLLAESSLEVYGGIRDLNSKNLFSHDLKKKLVHVGNLVKENSAQLTLDEVKPEVVINCAGLTKHKNEAIFQDVIMPINAYMPHRFASVCNDRGIRFIHISSDCVFSGLKGGYTENDLPDASDLYGKSKAFGEVKSGNTVTLRTSTIGHELSTKNGLLEWFLSQDIECTGFLKAIFSGLPSTVFAEVIKDFVLPNQHLQGLYHVSADPINKYDLLKLISKIYKKNIKINTNLEFTIDRSLNNEKFKAATGYIPDAWPDLIEIMYKNK